MAENKPGAGETTGYNLRPEGSGREPSGISRPPASMRRDPRADPDDEPVSARVDVVTVDRSSPRERPSSGNVEAASVDALTNAALTLRRELAKLHQQAAAVERTIEDQRRERSEWLERVDHANARAEDLTHKLELAETEIANIRRLHDAALEDLQTVRSQRDDLARAIDAAKGAADDLAHARAELETLRRAHEDAARAASTAEAQLTEIRKREEAEAQRASDTEREQGALRERLERVNAELAQSRDETAQNKAEVARLRQEAADAADAAAKRVSELERERSSAKEEIERLERSLAEARGVAEKVSALEKDLSTARVEAAEARTEITRLERDVEAARHARDVSLERAVMAEREAHGVRQEVERLQRELEAAVIASASATSRALAAERARASVEEGVKQLRDEVTTAFARWRSMTPSSPPAAENTSVAPPTRAVLPPSGELEASGPDGEQGDAPRAPEHDFDARSAQVAELSELEAAPVTKRGASSSTSVPPLVAESRPPSMPPPAPAIDDDWPTTSDPPPAARTSGAKTPDAMPAEASSPASRSVVPPSLPLPARPPPSPPPLPSRPSPQSIPPAVYPSMPPPAGVAPTPPPPPAAESAERPAAPPSSVRILSAERDELFELLEDPGLARDAATKLLEHPEWLRGRPPLELLMALTHLDYDVEAPIFDVARSWEREPISRALIAALRDEPEPKLREHGAWLLKHLGAANAWPALAELVSNEEEATSVRRWLLEAIERLVASRAIDWKEVGDLVQLLLRHPDPSLRDGSVGIVAALGRSDDKRRVLLEILRTDDDEVVLASAVHALTSVLPIDLDPTVAGRLLEHPSARVQRSVMEFIERSKRASAKS